MSKYDSLWKYVAENQPDKVTFADVEKICAYPLTILFFDTRKNWKPTGLESVKFP